MEESVDVAVALAEFVDDDEPVAVADAVGDAVLLELEVLLDVAEVVELEEAVRDALDVAVAVALDVGTAAHTLDAASQ